MTQDDIDVIRRHQRDFKSECDEATERGKLDVPMQFGWPLYHHIDDLVREVERLSLERYELSNLLSGYLESTT